MRAYTVAPVTRKQDYDGSVELPTKHKLGILARQSKKKQTVLNKESYEYQTKVQLAKAIRIGWKDNGDIIKFLENKRKDGKIIDASGAKRMDERPELQEMVHYIEEDEIKAVMARG